MFFNLNKVIDDTPTIGGGAYTANDVVGGLLTLNVANAGGGGTLRRLVVADDGDVKAELTFYFFTAAPTSIANNAAFAPVIADLKKLIGKVVVAASDYVTVNSNAYAIKEDIGIDFSVSGGNLYAYAVATATPTYTDGDLTFRFGFWLDASG